jgi:hypothetical protein
MVISKFEIVMRVKGAGNKGDDKEPTPSVYPLLL